MGLKSISTLIASVLLVGFTIASGVLIYYFTTTLPKVHMEKASGLSQEVIACAGGIFDIKYYNGLGLYRKAITIDNTLNPNNLTDYQVFINNPVFNESNLVLSFHFSEGFGNVTKDSSGYAINGELRGGLSGNADSGTNETCLVESSYNLPTCNAIREGQLIGYYIKVGSEIRTINYHKCIGGGHMVCWQNPIPGFTSGVGYEIYNEGDGTNGRGPRWVDGYFGKALSFDGVDDVVYFPDIYATGNLTNFTIIAWIKNKAPSNVCWNVIVGPPWGGNHLMVCGGKLTYLGGNTWVRGQTYIDDNKWHLVAVVHNTSNDVRLYVDGRFDNNFPTNLSGAPDAPLRIIGGTFDGLIDEVRIYMRALSEEEIKTLYKTKFRYDYGDIRFTDSDGSTLLNYYQGGEDAFWVKVPFIQANSQKTIYVYYGNPSATSLSSVSNTFIPNSIYVMSGSCTNSTYCGYMNNHAEANVIRGYPANICTKYVDKIYWGSVCDNSGPGAGVRDQFYSRFRFLFLPDVSGTWYFAVDSDDGSEIITNPKDLVIPSGEYVIATWYGAHGWCNCQNYNGSLTLTSNQPIWLDYIQEEWGGEEAAVVWVKKPGGNWVNLNTSNFPNQIFARKYTSPEPTVSISSEENITINLFSSGNPSASMGSQFTATIYLKNGTKIKKDFSLENNCNLGKDCVLGKSMINLSLNVAIDKIDVCSKACSLICSEFKPS